MGKETIDNLIQFLMPYPEYVQEMALWLHNFLWDQFPECNELIYDNYNALAFGHSLTDKAGDVICSVAVFAKHVNFGFNRGSEIPDPNNILQGNGSLYRYITIKNINDFPEPEIRLLLHDAYENAVSRLKPGKPAVKGQTITKSISPVKKRPA
jgi:hypothetical protein